MKNLANKIRKKMVQALSEYEMISESDRVLVAVSGGKDSTILALQLEEVRRRSRINFEIHLAILDQKQPGFNVSEYKQWLKEKDLNLIIIEEDTYSIVKEKTGAGKSYCGLCSRLRRGTLYNYAHNNGFNKIALGHHRDDLNETLLLNMFYSGSISSMPPKLISDDERNIIIRPLCYVAEKDLTKYSELISIPVIPCNLCGSQETLKRKRIKELLGKLEEENPCINNSILASLANVKSSHLLDKSLNDFSRY